MKGMSRDYQLSVRIPDLMRRALETEAYNERRSVADIINIMLELRYPANVPKPPEAKVVANPANSIKVGGDQVKVSKPSKKATK